MLACAFTTDATLCSRLRAWLNGAGCKARPEGDWRHAPAMKDWHAEVMRHCTPNEPSRGRIR